MQNVFFSKLQKYLEHFSPSVLHFALARVTIPWILISLIDCSLLCKISISNLYFSSRETEKTNISDILSEQQSFYKHLYSSTNPVINDVHKNAFLNDENPFITKISEDQKLLCEGELTEQE
jgi:hypothetical protein